MTFLTVTSVRASNPSGCTAGLLRFATFDELHILAGLLPKDRMQAALNSYAMPNRTVAGVLLRRGEPGDRAALVKHALIDDPDSSLLGRLLDQDDPAINDLLFSADGLGRLPRNLRRQLAHQTSRRDGVTPVPFTDDLRQRAYEPSCPDTWQHALLHSADPDLAEHALRTLGGGADPHGAARACRTLLDAGRTAELRDLVDSCQLPTRGNFSWGSDDSVPSVYTHVVAALASPEGAARLRELSERVRKPELLRSAAELADVPTKEFWRNERRPLVRTVVHRRRLSIPRVDWAALLADEPARRRRDGALPYAAARVMAARADTPPELRRLVVEDHPVLAPLIPDPSAELLTVVCERRHEVGAATVVKVAGNGLVSGEFTAADLIRIVPADTLGFLADALWVPGLRGTAALRGLLGCTGDLRLRPFLLDDTGYDGRSQARRDPAVREHWDPRRIYGDHVADTLRHHGDELTADQLLAMVAPDAVLTGYMWRRPDPRVLRRLAELVDVHLGGNPAAWTVALRLLEDGFAGTLPELLATAGAVGA